jgi:PiT family inorganic phosphate transporter
VDLLLLSVVALVGLALLFDFTNGMNDAAHSISTAVATRTMSARFAVWFSAVFNFLAYFVVGTAVANTVVKIVKADFQGVAVIFGALTAAVLWNYLAVFVGIPSSSSHAVIGGLIGAGLAAGGVSAIEWHSVQKTVLAIFLSPVVAFSVAGLATGLIWALVKVTKWSDNAKPFKGMQVVSAACMAFGHGANDAQKTMGIIAALLAGAGYIGGEGDKELGVPGWVGLAAYSAIALGTVYGGWKIIETVGLKITSLNARTGVAANIGAITAIFGATGLGIPISTTHASATSVVGAGVAGGRGTNWRVVGEMVTAWTITIPATATIGFLLYHATQFPTVFSWVLITPVMLGGAAFIIYVSRNRGAADHIDQAREDEDALAGAKTAAVTH